jgi:hypothetical protein
MPFSQDDYQLVQRTFRLPEITRLLFQTGGATPLRGPFYVSQLSGDEEKPVFGKRRKGLLMYRRK